jgi:hypothetical protein
MGLVRENYPFSHYTLAQKVANFIYLAGLIKRGRKSLQVN